MKILSNAGELLTSLEGATILDRYQLQKRLGSGGMGVVYEAFDTERRTNVALKVMRSVEGAALYRFKKEFRVLADLHHPNVVMLHELVATGNRWFLTMELINGISFREYVRRIEPVALDPETQTGRLAAAKAETDIIELAPLESSDLVAPAPPPCGVLDEARLRPALRQLCEGVAFLHRSRCLHRDIKPSNVLVAPDGRVVLCDFGLVKELTPDHHSKSIDKNLAGTVAYMSPEQARGEELTEASDWYSVGVMLYEALTGKLPYPGDRDFVIYQKCTVAPASPALVDAAVPTDLTALCMDLMAMDPAARPNARSVLQRLGATRLPLPASPMDAAVAPPFFGRKRELASLGEAYAHMRDGGGATTVFLHGVSGMGKSALLLEFLDRVRADDAIVLAGRCYERESVPYKGFDSVVDALSAHLLKLDDAKCRKLVPRDVVALSRLFPVLRRVEAIEEACVLDFEVPDPQESRRRAIGALRELLRRVARSQQLVLCIDDLQWGDTDTALLLADILRPPDAPPLLALLSYRNEDAAHAPILQALHVQRDAGALGEARELEIGALAPDEARALAAKALGRGSHAKHANAIAAESGGSPFFIGELARYMLAGAPTGAAVSLDEVLAFRIGQLPEDARALLSVVAVAGHPVAQSVAVRSAELTGDPLAALGELRRQHMIRAVGLRETDTLETYHDRIRETVVRSLDAAALRTVHGRLARTYELKGDADPEILVEHWRGAGRLNRAGDHAAVAAEQAVNAFAFDRAARLYRLALELGDRPPADRQFMRARLADALANGGRGAEAAEAFLEATKGASTADTLEFRRRAAECWLHTGHFSQGMDAIREVLASVGLSLAKTPQRALASLLSRRLWLRLRGLGYKRRDPTQVAREVLTRIDILRSVATGLSMIDVIHGADFNTRHLLAALRAGEPHQVARALAVEAAHTAAGGGKTRVRTLRLAAAATALATELEDPHALGLAKAVSGIGCFLRGEWRAARDLCREAEQVLRDSTKGTTWESTSAQSFGLSGMYYLGELRELTQVVPAKLREAEERGNLWFATQLRSWRTNVAWLALDNPDEARRQVELANRQWSREGFHLQHYYELLSNGQIDLYVGNGREGLERTEKQWDALASSLLLRVQNIRVETQHLRARCVIAEAKASGNLGMLDVATNAARKIAGERMPWALAIAQLISASVAVLRGDARAKDALLATEQALTAADMHLYAAVTRYRRGQLIGGEQGDKLAAAARDELLGLGARSPERIADMVAPGLC
jgi:eukaryotic-like serine/threonine-protein kinase